jgi:putative copper resistance protein D
MLTTQLIIARAVHIGASILLAGIFTFDLVILAPVARFGSGDSHEVENQLFRVAVWILVAALFSALLWFWLEVASMSGSPLKNAISATAWRTVLFETLFGRIWQLRLGLIAATFAFVAVALAKVNARRALVPLLWLISVIFLVSLAWISHAAAGGVHPLGLLGDMLHLYAAGGWIGGLMPLTIFLVRVRAPFWSGETLARVVHRFSTLSLCCVSVLIVTGISNSWLLVGSIYALFTTPYGRLLLLKLTLFAILIGFGARNRFLVKVKLLKAPTGPDLLPHLRRNVLCEICLGAAVVAVVACLGITPPARHSMTRLKPFPIALGPTDQPQFVPLQKTGMSRHDTHAKAVCAAFRCGDRALIDVIPVPIRTPGLTENSR